MRKLLLFVILSGIAISAVPKVPAGCRVVFRSLSSPMGTTTWGGYTPGDVCGLQVQVTSGAWHKFYREGQRCFADGVCITNTQHSGFVYQVATADAPIITRLVFLVRK